MNYQKGEVMQKGEVWLSPQGNVWKVMAVAKGEAVLRRGYDGAGTKTTRSIYKVINWTLVNVGEIAPNE